jgi:hypothetical protein
MTGYTVHTGASKKFVSGWDRIFADNASSKEDGVSKKSGKAKSDKSSTGKSKQKTEAAGRKSGKKKKKK